MATEEPSLATQKAKAEIAKLRADRLLVVEQTRKAAAEADAATKEPDSPTPVEIQKANAVAQKEIAEAERDTAKARGEQLSSLIPDLSTVKPGTLQVGTEGPAIGSSQLTFGGIGAAAERIAEDVQTTLGLRSGSEKGMAKWILITSDPDLASPDGMFQEVVNGIAQLKSASKDVLKQTDPTESPLVPPDAGASTPLVAAAAPVITALAGAIPGVLSLLSSDRSVKTAAVLQNDLAGRCRSRRRPSRADQDHPCPPRRFPAHPRLRHPRQHGSSQSVPPGPRGSEAAAEPAKGRGRRQDPDARGRTQGPETPSRQSGQGEHEGRGARDPEDHRPGRRLSGSQRSRAS